MKPHLSKWTKIYFMKYSIIVAIILFMQASCNKKDKPSSPIQEIQSLIKLPLTPYNPQPADGATGIDEDITFGWSCDAPDSGIIHYKIFLGTDSVREVSNPDTLKSHIPVWPKQAKAKEMLIQIYQMQKAYRTRFNSFCLNGCFADRYHPSCFDRLGIRIDTSDCYGYTIFSSFIYLYCTAIGRPNLNDPINDEWQITESGDLSHHLAPDNSDIDFRPGVSYLWRVLAYDEYGDSAYSPIWHFTTNPNLIVPGYSASPAHYSIPADYSVSVNCSTLFIWYCSNPQRDGLVYDYYFGIGENLQLRSQNQPDDFRIPEWRTQQKVRVMLDQIFTLQQSYRNSYGCYCLNGVTASYEENNFYRVLNACFAQNDPYVYFMISDCDSFSCTGVTNFDADANNDIWIIDQSGSLINIQNDSDVPFIAGAQYSWKVVAHDAQNNTFEGPIWHFIAMLDNYSYDDPVRFR